MEHEHTWTEGAVLHYPARFCTCGYFEEITQAHFKELFGRAFWRWAKEYADKVMFGGYEAWKREGRVFRNM